MSGTVSASSMLFGDLTVTSAVTEEALAAVQGEVPTIILVEGESEISMIDALVKSGLAKSKNEARRAIEQGGIYINQQRVVDPTRKLEPTDWIGGRSVLLRKGKKDYALLKREG